MKGITRYSQEVPGDEHNHGFICRFDVTDGYVGISQSDDGKRWSDRVLLSPKQLRALIRFTKPKKRVRHASR